MKKIVIIYGNNEQAKLDFLEKIKQKYGEYNFSTNLVDFNYFSQWIIITDHNLLSTLDRYEQNIVILTDFLYKIPKDLIYSAKLVQREYAFNFSEYENKKKDKTLLLKLFFARFKINHNPKI